MNKYYIISVTINNKVTYYKGDGFFTELKGDAKQLSYPASQGVKDALKSKRFSNVVVEPIVN